MEHLSSDADPGPAILDVGIAKEDTLVDFAERISDCAEEEGDLDRTVEEGDLAPDAKPSGHLLPWVA